MRKSLQLQRSDLVWAGVALLLVLLQFWWLPGTAGSTSDSTSNSLNGTLGIWRVCQQLFPDVRRERLTLLPDTSAALIVNSPGRLPSKSEERQLARFVHNGGSLLFAPARESGRPFGDPGEDKARRVSLSELNIHLVQSTGDWSGLDNPNPFTTPQDSWNFAVTPKDAQYIKCASSTAAWWPLGEGRIVVCLTPKVFSNRSLLDSRRAEDAVRIIEATHAGVSGSGTTPIPLIFSEYLTSSEAWRGTGVLFSPSLRLAFLQLTLALTFVLWRGFYRFGPVANYEQPTRRSLTDSARAMGSLQFRSLGKGASVGKYRNYLLSLIRRQFGRGKSLQADEALARRTGMQLSTLRSCLELSEQVSVKRNCSPAAAARLIHDLAEIRAAFSSTRNAAAADNQDTEQHRPPD